MKTIAENANDFADLRTLDGGNCVYVDKTDYFHRLVTSPGCRLFFIARPRRFGKSLMITTFKYIFDGLKALYAKLPYGSHEAGERKNEFSYQRPLCALLAAQGFRYDPEVIQTSGRSDLIAEHPSGIWIFELKVDESAESALAQIREKDYAAPYRARNLPIWAIGLAFDSKTRHLTGAVHECLG